MTIDTTAAPIVTTGQKCRQYVEARRAFRNSNGQLYGRHERGLYVVYSYGEHWPLYIYDGAQWLENSDTTSRTTAKHRGQARPHSTATTLASCKDMRAIIAAAWERRAA